jgi:Transposase DDE domain
MTASAVGYEQVRAWVEIMLGRTHATVVRTTAWIVLCVLLAQRVTAAALARALPADQSGKARARLTRGRRWWTGPPLDQTIVSPQLIQAALTLLPPGQPVVVALDTTRLGRWEVWLAGLVVRGRTMPIGWAVIPYPWPKGRFQTTTGALIQRLQGAFPANVSWSLVADRGFPSAVLFAQLRQANTAFSVRLRLNAWVTVAGVYAMVAEHLETGRLVVGQRTAAAMGRGRRDQPLVPGWVVVSAAVVVPPKHKQNPGTERERAKRAQAHVKHRARKYGRHTTPPSVTARRYAQTWILFTTAPTVAHAVAEYAQRMSIEETFRDWHSGWGVRAVAVTLPTETMVDRLIGVVCLTYSLQMCLGQRLSADPLGRQRRAQWTVTDRVSWFWCAQQLFDDPGDDWRTWLAAQWKALIDPLVPVMPISVPVPLVDKAA